MSGLRWVKFSNREIIGNIIITIQKLVAGQAKNPAIIQLLAFIGEFC